VLENVAGGGFVIAGSGPGDVWAATQLGNGTVRVFHRGGGSYDVFADDNPLSIVAISPTNVWLRGHETVHHWDGVAWKVSDAGTSMFGSNLSWDGKQLWTVVMRGLIRHP
jgi:hypothetical protein